MQLPKLFINFSHDKTSLTETWRHNKAYTCLILVVVKQKMLQTKEPVNLYLASDYKIVKNIFFYFRNFSYDLFLKNFRIFYEMIILSY